MSAVLKEMEGEARVSHQTNKNVMGSVLVVAVWCGVEVGGGGGVGVAVGG